MAAVVPPIQLCCFRRIQAYPYKTLTLNGLAAPARTSPDTCIGYKNIPVRIDDAPKAVQEERNVVTTIRARSAQRI